jgi:hypothetical protein
VFENGVLGRILKTGEVTEELKKIYNEIFIVCGAALHQCC